MTGESDSITLSRRKVERLLRHAGKAAYEDLPPQLKYCLEESARDLGLDLTLAITAQQKGHRP